VITFGTYDLFHIGHKNIFDNCKKYGSKLIVGVSSDELNYKKGKKAINNIDKRVDDCKNYQGVDIVFIEESLEEKINYTKYYEADLLIMGDDWKDKFDFVPILTKYLPRTPNISTTLLKSYIISNEEENID
jgi:glycerol-3-phosphate cytidylyltransferase